ncbi:alpha/beta fold hydrolase [Tomitella gaofuii]|uniref:alpha/beta fold hydrolase n=1 Tax=Tomitella gaofuii TaxID=2760083 RepID=UPI0015FA19C3|nr:alpha/beta fold hydrolase [Tomitella gaofuii]
MRRLSARAVPVAAALAAMLTAAPAVAVAAPQAAEVTTVHFAVTVGPGEQHCDIIGDLYRPAGATADAPVPAILATNGFGGSKDDLTAAAEYFSGRGYAVLAYSGLGFGGSGCRIGMDSRAQDGRAGSQLIGFLGGRGGIAFADAAHTRPVAAPDYIARDAVDHQGTPRDHDPRVGMIGGSYGGQIQFAVAAVDPRLDTITPSITWNDLSYSLVPNTLDQGPGVSGPVPGVSKLTWTAALAAAGFLTPIQYQSYREDPSRLAGCPNFMPEVCQGLAEGVATGTVDQHVIDTFRATSVSSYLSDVTVPTLLLQGEQDTLFDLREATTTYRALQEQGTEAKLVWQRFGHSSGGAVPGENPAGDEAWDPGSQYMVQRRTDWLDHYLKDAPTPTGPEFAYFRPWVDYSGNAAPAYAESPTVDVGVPRTLALSGDGSLTAGPATDGAQSLYTLPGGLPTEVSAPAMAPAMDVPTAELPGSAAAWTTAPAQAPVDIVGGPTLRLTVATERPLDGSVEDSAVVFAKLYDVAPDGTAMLIDGLVSPVRVLDPSQPVTVDMRALVHRIDTGHRLRLVVAGGDVNYRGGITAHRITIPQSGAGQGLTLPVVPSVAPNVFRE